MSQNAKTLVELLHAARTRAENARFALAETIAEQSRRNRRSEKEQLQSSEQATTIYGALLSLSPSLANSYAQIKDDLDDETRISWAGTAHEIREVLATTLRLLAPDEDVLAMSWFVKAENTSGPTQAQRVRFILEQQGAGSRQTDVIENVASLDEMIMKLVRATYSRASDAAHRFKEREEVRRIFRYFEAFAADLLHVE